MAKIISMAETTLQIRPSEEKIRNVLLPLDRIKRADLICEYCKKSFQNRSAKRFHLVKTHQLKASLSYEKEGIKLWKNLNIHLGVDEEILKGNLCFYVCE